MEHETAGDPVSGCKWTHKTTGKIARQLSRVGIQVSDKTVGRLMKKMDYSLRLNLKSLESGQGKPVDPRKRNLQFRYIKSQINKYKAAGLPVLSADTKSRELIGRFHQAGRKWGEQSEPVFDHDFPSDSSGVAIPYGIQDLTRNEGYVRVGTSRDTSEFAVDSICSWWRNVGYHQYPNAGQLLVLVDSGGSNGYRVRLWKHQLQVVFCNRFGLHVKICHYPPGSSKWNPIEHRMFSFISRNWAGQPLESYETVLKFIRTTKTSTGLKIRASLNKKKYYKGIKISNKQMKEIAISRYTQRPDWNYAIAPSNM